MNTQLLAKLVNRKVLLLTGVLAVSAWAAYPQLAPQSAAPVVAQTVSQPKVPVDSLPPMPAGFQQPAVYRDPFQTPKEALPPSKPASAYAGRTASPPPPTLPQFELTGVAIGNGTAAAILESSSGSRSYRVGEYAGPFQVRSIKSDSVVLVGPNGPQVLKMRR